MRPCALSEDAGVGQQDAPIGGSLLYFCLFGWPGLACFGTSRAAEGDGQANMKERWLSVEVIAAHVGVNPDTVCFSGRTRAGHANLYGLAPNLRRWAGPFSYLS
jgi:hypothetical protein